MNLVVQYAIQLLTYARRQQDPDLRSHLTLQAILLGVGVSGGLNTKALTLTLSDAFGAVLTDGLDYDGFTYTTGAELNGLPVANFWTAPSSANNVQSGVAATNAVAGLAGESYRNYPQDFGDQFSQATITTNIPDQRWAVVVRWRSSDQFKYAGGRDVTLGTGNYEIWKENGSGFVSLQTSATALVVNDVVRLEVIGTSLSLYVNGSLLISATDSEIATGKPGFMLDHNAAASLPALDNWRGGPQNVFKLGFGLRLTDDNSANWSDGTASINLQKELSIICEEQAGNWLDAFAETHVSGDLTLAVSDDLNNWADVVYIGYGAATSDQLVLTDSISSGYGFVLSDNLNSWADIHVLVVGFVVNAFQAIHGLVLSNLINSADEEFTSINENDGGGTDVIESFYLRQHNQRSPADGLPLWSDFVSIQLDGQIRILLVDSFIDVVFVGYGDVGQTSVVGTSSLFNLWRNHGYRFVSQPVISLICVDAVEVARDGFDRGDGPLGVNWSSIVSLPQPEISGQKVVAQGVYAGAVYSGAQVDVNGCFVEVLIADPGTAVYLDLDPNGTYISYVWVDGDYYAYLNTPDDFVELTEGVDLNPNSVLRLERSNNQCRAYVNNVLKLTAVSNSLVQGLGAIELNPGVVVDNFVVGELRGNLADSAQSVLGLALVLVDSNAANWSDFTPTQALDYLLALACPHLGDNWLDLEQQQLTIALTLSDDNGANWNDFVAIGYGITNSDQLVLVDSISAGYGFVLNDDGSGNWADSLGVGYGVLFADDLNNWLDSITVVLGLNFSFADNNAANWADVVFLGYGISNSDQLVLTDSISAGYGFVLSDSFTLTDQTVLALGLNFAFSDALVLVDSLGAGYGLLISDDLNNWSDAGFAITAEFELDCVDDLNNWLDATFVVLGLNFSLSDQLVIVDSLGSGYGLLLNDDLNNWLDAFEFSTGDAALTKAVSDSLNFWADFLGAGYGDGINDELTLTDSMSMGYGLLAADAFTLTDAVTIVLGLHVAVSDNLNSWADFVAVGYGDRVSDDFVISDSFSMGYGLAMTDSFSLSDQVTLVLGLNVAASDVLLFVDSLSAGYGLFFSQDLNNWLDFVAIGYGDGLSDDFVITDSAGLGYGLSITDDLNNWTDAVVVLLEGGSVLSLVVSDNLNNWADALLAGIGLLTSDQLVLTDSLAAGYGFLLSDQLVLTDSIAFVFSLQMANSDSMTMVDFLFPTLSFEVQTSDSNAVYSDLLQLLLQFQIAVNENANLWADFLGALQTYNLAIQDIDSTWADEARLNLLHLLQLADDGSGNWNDQYAQNLIAVLAEVLADDNGANWLDSILLATAVGVGPVLLRSAGIAGRVLLRNVQIKANRVDMKTLTVVG